MKLCFSCNHKFESDDWICPKCEKEPAISEGFLSFAPELALENEGFKGEYFEKLYELEDSHFWFRSRNKLITWAISKYFPDLKRFLEIGCGTGFVLNGIHKTFPDVKASGSEIFTAGLGFAKARLPGVELFQLDARALPFESEFDMIGAFDVLEHIEEDEAVLKEIHRAVRDDGGIIITVPQHQFLWSEIDDYSYHVRRYSARELREKVERAGFKVIHMTSFISFLLPLLTLSRFMKKMNKKEVDPYAETAISPALNRILGMICAPEIALIRMGLSLPAGGSLVLLAKKDSKK